MKSLPDAELMKLAATRGPEQYLAFDEIARRIRDNPAGSCVAALQGESFREWSPIDITRSPNATEMEWAMLKLSQHLNEDQNPELERQQEALLRELEGHLDEDPDSLATKFYNAIAEYLRQHDKDGSA